MTPGKGSKYRQFYDLSGRFTCMKYPKFDSCRKFWIFVIGVTLMLVANIKIEKPLKHQTRITAHTTQQADQYRDTSLGARGSVAEWFVRLTTKLVTRVRSRVAAGLPTGYSVLGGNLFGYCCQQYRPRLDNLGGNDTQRGLCWK